MFQRKLSTNLYWPNQKTIKRKIWRTQNLSPNKIKMYCVRTLQWTWSLPAQYVNTCFRESIQPWYKNFRKTWKSMDKQAGGRTLWPKQKKVIYFSFWFVIVNIVHEIVHFHHTWWCYCYNNEMHSVSLKCILFFHLATVFSVEIFPGIHQTSRRSSIST